MVLAYIDITSETSETTETVWHGICIATRVFYHCRKVTHNLVSAAQI
jgi:hypothetical protein